MAKHPGSHDPQRDRRDPKKRFKELKPKKITTAAQARTQAKVGRALVARAKGGTATSRLKGRISITESTKAFDSAKLDKFRAAGVKGSANLGRRASDLTKLSKIARKSRSPFLLSFALGLDELLKQKKAKKVNVGPI